MSIPASASRWSPVLACADANAALDAARAIDEALARLETGEDHPATLDEWGGRALLAVHLARGGGERVPSAQLARRGKVRFGPRLFTDALGAAWTAAHLGLQIPRFAGGRSLDDELISRLDDPAWPADFDLFSGLVAIGIYALERGDDGDALLDSVVRRLDDRAVAQARGIAWPTPATRPGPEPAGSINLGVAHGGPGVVGLLASAVSAGRGADRARELLDGAVEGVMAQCVTGEERNAFPYGIERGEPTGPARTAWCYGDAGVGLVLMRAAQALERADLADRARGLMLAVAGRDPEVTGVVDSGLCHGAAGLGLIFARAHQLTGDQAFGDAARRWFRDVLAQREPERIGAFEAFDPVARRMGADPRFLTGSAGIGLALCAAASDIEPAWDRVLLLSGPPP